MKLMIVDDHAGVRAMIQRIIAEPGDEVCECADGGEALQVAEAFAPDFVTMDLRMPGIGGLEATRGILALRPGTPIVVVSAHDGADLREAAAAAGARGFVAKERLHDLRASLRAVRGLGQ